MLPADFPGSGSIATASGALLLVFLTTLAAMDAASRALHTQGRQRRAWLAGGTLAVLCGITGAHGVALLTLAPEAAARLTIGAASVGIVACTAKAALGFQLCDRRLGRTARMAAGAMFGLSFAMLPALTGALAGLFGAAAPLAMALLAATGAATGLTAGYAAMTRRGTARMAATGITALLGAIAVGGVFLAFLAENGAPSREGAPEGVVAVTAAAILMFLAMSTVYLVLQRRRLGAAQWDALRLERLAAAAFNGSLVHRGGHILWADDGAAAVTGLSPEELKGKPLLALVAPEHMQRARDMLTQAGHPPFTVDLVRADGTRLPFEVATRPLSWRGQEVLVSGLKDIKCRRAAEVQAQMQVMRDPLTHLPNRVLVQDRLEQAINRARSDSSHLTVLRIDLADVDSLRAELGETSVQDALKSLADVVRFIIADTDTLGRIDDTGLVLVQTAEDQPSACTKLGRDLSDALATPLTLRGSQRRLNVAMGAAVYPWDGETVDTLLDHAQVAARRAAADASTNLRFYEQSIDANFRSRRSLEHDLRAALENNEFSLAFQPQLDLRTDRVVGFEALIRWNHPRRGVVSPAEFIPLAEETGLIIPIGAWVLEAACREAVRWGEALRVAVNVSPQQFASRGFIETVDQTLRMTGLFPERLELEITEHSVLSDVARSRQMLWDLKERGIEVAIDDFGTGYSSLAYLREFRFDKLKIDRSFITGIDYRENSLAIVRAVIALSRALGLKVIAEGVETLSEMELLKSDGCDEIQGFVLSRPIAPAEIPGFLARRDGSLVAFDTPRLRSEPRLLSVRSTSEAG